YFGLAVSGMADEQTLTKMQEFLSSPLQYGKRHTRSIQLKKDLNTLGFASFHKPNNYFGTKTRNGIKDFQRAYGLPVSGIADDRTLDEIQKALDQRSYTQYDLSLAEALSMQMQVNPQTDQKYAYVSKNYINGNSKVRSEEHTS